MDFLKITEMLDLHPYGQLTLNGMHLAHWGRVLLFSAVYDPGAPGKPAPFRLIFFDCRDLNWQVYSQHPIIDGQLPASTVIKIALGAEGYRQPASLLTDHFGVTVSYDTRRFERL